MDDIARESHKGESTIYYNFKSKDEIFKAVIDTEAEIRAKSIADQIRDISDSKLKQSTNIYVRMQSLRMVVNYYEAIKNDLLDNLYFVNSLRCDHFEDEIKQVRQMLLEGIDVGDYTIQNPELIAKTIVTLLHGFEVSLILKTFQMKNSINRLMKCRTACFMGL